MLQHLRAKSKGWSNHLRLFHAHIRTLDCHDWTRIEHSRKWGMAEERCHIFLLFADVAAALANLQAGKLNMCPTNGSKYGNVQVLPYDWKENECRRRIGCFCQVHLSTPAISLAASSSQWHDLHLALTYCPVSFVSLACQSTRPCSMSGKSSADIVPAATSHARPMADRLTAWCITSKE